jgi:XTP/dITP diphosphohydrolase
MKLLIATTNPGKILEYKHILSGLPIEVLSLKDVGLENEKVEEDGKTFEENAIKKARFFSEAANLSALSDDGGIEVDYLFGEPGVKSRRWPGYEATDQELVEIILEKLKGVPREKRGAQLRCIIALAFPGEEKIHLAEGILRGTIVENPTGIISGFPFRSVLYLPSIGKILGELSIEEETKVAHRKKAMEKIIPVIKEKIMSDKVMNRELN